MSQETRAAGPLGRMVSHVGVRVNVDGQPARAGANPWILLHRTAFLTREGLDKDAVAALLGWADEHDLGQERWLVQAAHERRERAVARAVSGAVRHRRVLATPQWRLAVGLGNRLNSHEIGLSLHGTYGFPVVPGSTVKGVTRAWAVMGKENDIDEERFDRIFGRDGEGAVRFLDALPTGPVTVSRDVVTPHVQPYYQGIAAPAEHHNPIPTQFLVVTGGLFAFDLLGPDSDVTAATDWCEEALDALGIGGKTHAGYGYLTTDRSLR